MSPHDRYGLGVPEWEAWLTWGFAAGLATNSPTSAGSGGAADFAAWSWPRKKRDYRGVGHSSTGRGPRGSSSQKRRPAMRWRPARKENSSGGAGPQSTASAASARSSKPVIIFFAPSFLPICKPQRGNPQLKNAAATKAYRNRTRIALSHPISPLQPLPILHPHRVDFSTRPGYNYSCGEMAE